MEKTKEVENNPTIERVTITVKNKTKDDQFVKLFHKDQKLNPNVEVQVLDWGQNGSSYEDFMDYLVDKQHLIRSMRIYSETFPYIKPFCIGRLDKSGEFATIRVFPLWFYFPDHLNNRVVYIKDLAYPFGGGSVIDMTIPGDSEQVTISLFFVDNVEEYKPQRNQSITCLPVILKNDTETPQSVRLFDAVNPINPQLKLSVGNKPDDDTAYLHVIEHLKTCTDLADPGLDPVFGKYNHIKVFSKNEGQLNEVLHIWDADGKSREIVPIQHSRLDNWNYDCVPIFFDYQPSLNCPIEYTIQPKTEVVLMFGKYHASKGETCIKCGHPQ